MKASKRIVGLRGGCSIIMEESFWIVLTISFPPSLSLSYQGFECKKNDV